MTLPAVLQGLLASCKNQPEDDAPRLVLADWLEENGQLARADFIRLQCRFHATAEKEPDHSPDRERLDDLLSRYQAEWLGPLNQPGWTCSFQRGLVHLKVPARELVAGAKQVAGTDALD